MSKLYFLLICLPIYFQTNAMKVSPRDLEDFGNSIETVSQNLENPVKTVPVQKREVVTDQRYTVPMEVFDILYAMACRHGVGARFFNAYPEYTKDLKNSYQAWLQEKGYQKPEDGNEDQELNDRPYAL